MAISRRVEFPVRSAEWKSNSRFIMLSMITFIELGRHSLSSLFNRGPHLKVCRIRCIPAPCTTNHRIKTSSEYRSKLINSVDRGLVRGVSSNLGVSVPRPMKDV